MRSRNYFGSMMVAEGDADGLISGLTYEYADTIRPALQVIHTRPGVKRVAGAYILILKDRMFFFADTTVNIDPDAETPRDFGRHRRRHSHPSARKARRAVEIVRERAPELAIEGEMQADTAVMASVLQETYPWARLGGPANVLIFPELNSANTAYKLIWRLAGAEAIGPILLGMARPVHVLQRGVEVSDIVNMAAICVVDAQEYAARQE